VGVPFDGAGAAAQCVSDLTFGHVFVEPQDQDQSLSPGQPRQRRVEADPQRGPVCLIRPAPGGQRATGRDGAGDAAATRSGAGGR
jgi:hypothetical protein